MSQTYSSVYAPTFNNGVGEENTQNVSQFIHFNVIKNPYSQKFCLYRNSTHINNYIKTFIGDV